MKGGAASTPVEPNRIHLAADVSMLYAIDYSAH